MLEDKLFQGGPNISETYRSEVQLWDPNILLQAVLATL